MRSLGERTEPAYKRRQIRLAIDIVASLSDRQAARLFSRLRGMELGKITDFITG